MAPQTPDGTELTLILGDGGAPPTLHWAWASGGASHTLCGIGGIFLEANPDYAEVAAQCPLCAMFAALLDDAHHAGEATSPEMRWADDAIQFPRLLAEIAAVGLSPEQDAELSELMDDLDENLIGALFDRAVYRWEAIKAATP